MTEEEKRDLNRRVALALGWNQVKAGCVDKWRGTIMGWTVESVDTGISPKAGGNAGMPEEVPDYCTDPAAADMVRREVERRGWDWDTQGYVGDGGTRRYSVVIGRMNAMGNMFQRGRSTDSLHHALCLAFLAACDAETAAKAEEIPV